MDIKKHGIDKKDVFLYWKNDIQALLDIEKVFEHYLLIEDY